MKKVILALTIIVFLSISTPAQAAWYDWFLGAKKEAPIEITDTNNSKLETTQIAPVTEIESLKAEVAALTANLDSLYKAHNALVEDHNALLKYVNATASSGKSAGTATNNSNLETKVTSLDKKLDAVCSQIFSSLGGFGKCPSSSFIVGATLESRIKKLESGF